MMPETIDHDGPFVHRWRGAAAPVLGETLLGAFPGLELLELRRIRC
jgi:hypothetical protein